MQAIREAVQLPLLRKDFIIDERQIYEARLLGADAVLLIAAILDDTQLRDYLQVAASLGLDSLVEVHDQTELDRVLSLGTAKLIGINNRNLKTFETTLQVTADLAKQIPDDVTLISESGIQTPGDIQFLADCGAKGVLIGETFMRQPDVEQAVYDVMGSRSKIGQ
ncbi:Indole-3-glycerol phosphate synthase [compost metagenome]